MLKIAKNSFFNLEVENCLFPVGVLVIGAGGEANAAFCLAELASKVHE